MTFDLLETLEGSCTVSTDSPFLDAGVIPSHSHTQLLATINSFNEISHF